MAATPLFIPNHEKELEDLDADMDRMLQGLVGVPEIVETDPIKISEQGLVDRPDNPIDALEYDSEAAINNALSLEQNHRPAGPEIPVITAMPTLIEDIAEGFIRANGVTASSVLTGTAKFFEFPDAVYNNLIDTVNFFIPDLISDSWKLYTEEYIAGAMRKYFEDPNQVPYPQINQSPINKFIGQPIRELAEVTMQRLAPGGPRDIGEKVLVGLGQMVPDVGMIMLGGAGVSKLISSVVPKVNMMISHLLGVAGFAAVTASEQEHAAERGSNMSAIDMVGSIFRNYSLPTRMVFNGLFFSEYSSAMAKFEGRAEAPGEKTVNFLTGAVATAFTPQQRVDLKGDLQRLTAPIVNFIKIQNAVKGEASLPVYLANNMPSKSLSLERVDYSVTEVKSTRDLQNHIARVTHKKVTSTGKELAADLQNAVKHGPNGRSISEANAKAFADTTVKRLEAADRQHKIEQKGLEPPEILKEPAKEELTEVITYTDFQGKSANMEVTKARKAAIEEGKRVMEEQLSFEEGLIKRSKRNLLQKGMRAAERFYSVTAAPEYFLFKQLRESNTPQSREVMLDINHQYTVPNKARLINDSFIKDVGLLKMDKDRRIDYANYILAKSELGIIRRKTGEERQTSYSEEALTGWIADIEGKILTLDPNKISPDNSPELSIFHKQVETYSLYNKQANARLVLNNVITTKTQAKLDEIFYVKSEELAQVQADLIRSENMNASGELSFFESVKKLAPGLGGFRNRAVFDMMRRRIFTTEKELAEHNKWEALGELSIVDSQNNVARESIFLYNNVIMKKGKLVKVEIARDEFLKLEKSNLELKKKLKLKKSTEKDMADAQETVAEKLDYTDFEVRMQKGENKKLEAQYKSLTRANRKRAVSIDSGKIFEPSISKKRGGDEKISTSINSENKVELEAFKANNAQLREAIKVQLDIAFELQTQIKGHRISKSNTPLEIKGWTNIKYKHLDKDKYITVRDDMVEVLKATSPEVQAFNNARMNNWIGRLTGTHFVKGSFVAFQPFFSVYTTPRDINHMGQVDTAVTNMFEYWGFSAVNYPISLADAMIKGPRFRDYIANDGFTGTSGSVTAIAQSAFRNKSTIIRPNDWSKNSELVRKGWNNFIDIIGFFNYSSEMAVRLNHTSFLKSVKGLPAKEAVAKTNRNLNFGRNGSVMKTIEKIIPFANVATQGLDANLRAFADNPGVQAQKFADIVAMKALVIGIGFALGPEEMLRQTIESRVFYDNFPVTNMVAKDIDGKPHSAITRIPSERNIVNTLASIMANQMYDKYYGRDNSKAYARLAFKHLTSINDLPVFPAMSAMLAVFGNINTRDWSPIFSQFERTDPEAHKRLETSRAAVATADFINDYTKSLGIQASPVGMEVMAQQMGIAGNLFFAFGGMIMSKATGTVDKDWAVPNESMSREIWKAGKPVWGRGLVWNRVDQGMTTLKDDIRTSQTVNEVERLDKVAFILDQTKRGEITFNEGVNSFKTEVSQFTLDDAVSVSSYTNQYNGWKNYDTLVGKLNKRLRPDIPDQIDFRAVADADPSFQAKWMQGHEDVMRKASFKTFEKLSVIFGILNLRSADRLKNGFQIEQTPGIQK